MLPPLHIDMGEVKCHVKLWGCVVDGVREVGVAGVFFPVGVWDEGLRVTKVKEETCSAAYGLERHLQRLVLTLRESGV